MPGAIAVAASVMVLAAARPATDPASVLVGGVGRHTIANGESLRSIGSRLGIDPATLASDNALRLGAAIEPGQVLLVDNRHIVPARLDDGTIVVNIPQRMVFYAAGMLVFSAPVAVGSRGWPTPLASFTVIAKEKDPTWDVPESIAAEARARGQPLPAKVPPGPNNPLGRHWLGLSVGSVGIHGTNAPASIYRAATHGCIRVHPDDMAVLFDLVGAGTAGRTIYEPVLLVDDGVDVFLEAHPDVYRRSRVDALEQGRILARMAGLMDRIDWVRAESVTAASEGVARVVTKR